MIVLTRKTFFKDLKKINDSKLLNTIADVIEVLQESENLDTIPNLKKMKNSINAYRIRIRNFRLGFYINDSTIELARFLHRSSIYNYFPQ